MEPREGDCVKLGIFFKGGLMKVHKGGFISPISDIKPAQFPAFAE